MPLPECRPVPRALPPHRLVSRLGPRPGMCALDAAGPEGWGTGPGSGGRRCSLLALEPEAIFRGGLEALVAALAWLEERRGREPWAAGLAGLLSYDLGRTFERLPQRAVADLDLPFVWLGAYRALYRYDPLLGTGEVVGGDRDAVDRLTGLVCEACGSGREVPPPPLPAPRGTAEGARRFTEGVCAVRRWIRAGDVYQVNLSRRVELGPLATGTPAALYAALTSRSPAPFAAYVDAGDFRVVSNSPERFLRVRDGRVETCPIKGTRPRGASPDEDRRRARELVHAEKDRAEHVMIVDLERNDLGRVCQVGSVHVERLAELRSYATVHHLVSSVQGRLCDSRDTLGLLRATFPGGSITGAPKIRAMEIIESLEPVRRGVYTGALGWLDAAGGIDLSIAIRTATILADTLYLHLGGGIVWDSDAEDELRETRDKGGAFAALWGGAA